MSTTATDQFFSAFRLMGGVANSRLRISALPGGQRGVLFDQASSCRTFEAESPLIRVPSPLVITTATAKQSEIVRSCCTCAGDSSEALQIALFVLTERARGTASDWHWYINMLPASGAGALFLDDMALEALTGTPLRMAADAKLRHLRKQHNSFRQILDAWKTTADAPGSIDFEEFKWATFIVLSRTVSLQSCRALADEQDSQCPNAEDDRALVPLLDTLNHSNEPLARWSVDSDGAVSVFLNVPADSTRSDVARDSAMELTFSYGLKPNTEWVYEYGFMPERNSHDAWPYFTPLSGSPSFVDIKRMWMLELGLTPRVMLSDPGRHRGTYTLPRSTMLSLCLAALDDTSDACLQQIGPIALAYPLFEVRSFLVDGDDKLLQIPNLREYALVLCSRCLARQASTMQTSLDTYSQLRLPDFSSSAQQQYDTVTNYLTAELAAVRRIADCVDEIANTQ
ncbi:hypothetical protein GGI11_007737 [Coemansia sp. RSA 2049]|nr:hypothetical protein GGI11_007737 [Coemansia sp. RSA 2049]